MPAALVASCVERAEGNPLFLLQLLLDAGEAAQTEPARLDPGARPHAHGPARRRRQGRPAGGRGARPALRGGSAAPSSRPRRATTPRLLVENFLVRADGGEFMFCHALIRDGAYASLLHKRRRALHARAAEWFASPRRRARRRALRPRRGSARRRGVPGCERHARAQQFRHATALALVERGLALAVAQETRFALLMARGRLLVELGRLRRCDRGGARRARGRLERRANGARR